MKVWLRLSLWPQAIRRYRHPPLKKKFTRSPIPSRLTGVCNVIIIT
jgi:hypothetical protein